MVQEVTKEGATEVKLDSEVLEVSPRVPVAFDLIPGLFCESQTPHRTTCTSHKKSSHVGTHFVTPFVDMNIDPLPAINGDFGGQKLGVAFDFKLIAGS